MLREHFRCVPDIIGYSNKLSYDYKIKPLRDSSNSIVTPPVVSFRVDGGQREGKRKINSKEAETVVALMMACMEQKEYDGETFGVMASWTALPKDHNIAYAFNLILPDQYGELAEGCQRNNDYKLFMHKFEQADIHVLNWYADAIKSSKTDRSGFGLGMERLIRWVTGSKKITDTVLFPRFTEER
jgi:hypothetical protein